MAKKFTFYWQPLRRVSFLLYYGKILFYSDFPYFVNLPLLRFKCNSCKSLTCFKQQLQIFFTCNSSSSGVNLSSIPSFFFITWDNVGFSWRIDTSMSDMWNKTKRNVLENGFFQLAEYFNEQLTGKRLVRFICACWTKSHSCVKVAFINIFTTRHILILNSFKL